jgi:3-oxoacyl-[acyl-carrier-protein] synthase II
MTTSSRRVVITGFGLITPLGLTPESIWQNLLASRSGVRAIRSFDPGSAPSRIAGEIDDFNAKSIVDKAHRKSLAMMARPIQLAVAGAQIALAHGRVDTKTLDPVRFGVEFGAGLMPSELPELADAGKISTIEGRVDMQVWGESGLSAVGPKWMLKYLPNMPACHISIMHNAQGPNNSITESDAASLLALSEAYRILKRDGADFFLVGGTESKIHPLSLVRQCLFEQISTRNDEPEKACRPFDRRRDGLVISEGSGVLVVEELEHAKKRGATPWAEVVGIGASFDAKRNGDGMSRAIVTALKNANLTPDDLDHVVAHGLGTSGGDSWEAKGLSKALGQRVPIVAFKGYFGNLGAASGAVELAVSVMALGHKVCPATLNHDEADPDLPSLTIHRGSSKAVSKPYALKLAFTQMGQCSAVVYRSLAS